MNSDSAAVRPRDWSLQFLLSVLLASVVLLAGGVVGGLAWWNTRSLMLEAADHEFRSAAHQTEVALHKMLAPAASQLESLALQPPATETSMRGAQPLRQLLLNQPQVDAVFVGGDDGYFFLLRPLRDPLLRQRLGAVEGATYMVQIVQGGERRDVYLDDWLEERGRALPQVTDFDPRVRPWFKLAESPGRRVLTEPYVFFTTEEPGLTLAVRSKTGTVLGADISLMSLGRLLADLRSMPSMRILLLDRGNQVIASSRPLDHLTRQEGQQLRLARLDEFGDALLKRLAAVPVSTATHVVEADGQAWKVAVLPVAGGAELRLAIAAPMAELVAGATVIRNRSLAITVLVLVFGLALAMWLARRIALRLAGITSEARAVRQFDFSGTDWQLGWTREINELGESINMMKRTIRRFVEITASLASERRLDSLIGRVARESSAAVGAAEVQVWLPDAAGRSLQVAAGSGSETSLKLAGDSPEARAWRSGSRVMVTEAGSTRLVVPLKEREGERVGVLSLVIAGSEPPGEARLAFVEQIAGASAVAIETRRLLDERKALLDAFIRVLAGAIDAKSMHTGAHCQRVPEITLALARAACEATQGPFATFQLNPTQWEALEIASWLHDCGKVSTPDYVIDKATKLEMMGDRLNEVRMRFEVLKRDAEIAHWRRVAAGGSEAESHRTLEAEWAALDQDYAFVAACNRGGETLSAAAVARLHAIAERRWLRTLDDRIGLSNDAAARREVRPAPAWESLLADRPEHCVPRSATELAALERARNLGMSLTAPEYAYDHGELKCLSVARGTLTEEERYLVKHHIVQTVLMLEQLPLPRNLAVVPEIAGSHHEKIDGTGYPRGLSGPQLSVPARMMAIADVFEALTANDRPYKPGKTLSETLALMAEMSRNGHLDPELFGLFVDAGVWRDYAERFLKPEQIDLADAAAARAWVAEDREASSAQAG